ncbi:MAG: hypothetical protein JNM76_14545 [Betaproteobacteria bacterium]|nr:hypothetical protein [Betaproteobacteria bacterium]
MGKLGEFTSKIAQNAKAAFVERGDQNGDGHVDQKDVDVVLARIDAEAARFVSRRGATVAVCVAAAAGAGIVFVAMKVAGC